MKNVQPVSVFIDHETPWVGLKALIGQATCGHLRSLQDRSDDELRKIVEGAQKFKDDPKSDGIDRFCASWAKECSAQILKLRARDAMDAKDGMDAEAAPPAEGFGA